MIIVYETGEYSDHCVEFLTYEAKHWVEPSLDAALKFMDLYADSTINFDPTRSRGVMLIAPETFLRTRAMKRARPLKDWLDEKVAWVGTQASWDLEPGDEPDIRSHTWGVYAAILHLETKRDETLRKNRNRRWAVIERKGDDGWSDVATYETAEEALAKLREMLSAGILHPVGVHGTHE